mgnify:CR=1 FL=1
MTPESVISQAWPFAAAPRRVVLKVGSNVLAGPHGGLDERRLRSLATQAAALRAGGAEVILVTSGAVAAGLKLAGLHERPREAPRLQALAAIGQGRLIGAWTAAFEPHGLRVAQVLLTRSDLEDRQRYLNATTTLETLLELGAIPVINENDTVATEELTFGDNDLLSAFVAAAVRAELLVLLTDTDGLFSAHPDTPGAVLVPVVERITEETEGLATGPGSKLGRGGMKSKINAARHAVSFGVSTVIANGRREGVLAEVASGRFRGTLFPARGKAGRNRARTHWISTRKPRGVLRVDAGAERALREEGRSLLPVGVRAVEGDFDRGDVVSVVNEAGAEVARGVASLGAEALRPLCGKKKGELPEGLPASEAVHRNNLFLRL